jgi:hypothetical protein
MPEQDARVTDADRQPGEQREAQVRHATGRPEAVAGHISDGEHHPVIGQGLCEVPVAADLDRALGRQVGHGGVQPGQLERLGRDGLDHALQLAGQAMLGQRGDLPLL